MGTLNPNIPTTELARLLTDAAGKRQSFGKKLLTPQLLLHAFLADKESVAHQILRQLQKQRGFDWDDLARRVEQMARYNEGRDAEFNFTDDFGKDIPLADETLILIDEGLTIAKTRDELKVGSGHALAAMSQPNVTTYGVLQRLGITATAVITLLGEVAQDGTPIIHDYVSEAKAGNASSYYQRKELLQELMSSLSLTAKRHIILVGEEGSGRRTLVYSFAQLLAEGKGGNNLRSVVEMSETALLENPLATLRVGLRRASGGILLVPDIHRFFGNRLNAAFPQQVNNDLHKALLGNDHVIIGTTTVAEYGRLQDEAIIRQQTNRLNIPATNKDETSYILGYHHQRLEDEYEIVVKKEALETAVQLASQYLKTVALPAAAIQLTDRASAIVHMVTEEHLWTLPEVPPDGRLDSEDILYTVSQMTNIPLTKLNEDEQSKYANMTNALHERIIGQEEAVQAVSRAVKTARVGLRDRKRPIGSFLFLGPSGVGKSELAKALAEFMFGTEDAMIVLDMSEYQEEASVNRLIGAPPGYIGFEGGGQLTDFVRERPYTVVLFDEVEKAHPKVLDILLQMMDEGRLTDSKGRLTAFNETVIIMTSNLGADHMLIPIIDEPAREQVMNAVHRFFRPEFLNRLDEIIMFHQLTPPQLAKILDLMLRKEYKLTAEQGIKLEITDSAKTWLLAQNDQPEFGARPLRRIIARHLREPLADFLLSTKKGEGETAVRVDEVEGELHFEIG